MREKTGQKAYPELLTHCRKEITHSAFLYIFDKEFPLKWDEGFVIKCGDGITRRCYPRLVSYSADYPEKYVSATFSI